ncbi:MAG: MarC family protein [Acidobacteriota bacterium]
MTTDTTLLTVATATTLLFLVMDPFGNIPFFIAALKTVEKERRFKVTVRELFIALFIMVLFLFVGPPFLSMLHVSEAALAVAGGIVLFLIAVKMIFPAAKGHTTEDVEGEPFIVPLAVPYVAGPSTMATVMLIINKEPERRMEWLLAVFLAWAASSLIICLSGPLSGVLGKRGLLATERLMGMLLVVVAIQMLMSGTAAFVATLP